MTFDPPDDRRYVATNRTTEQQHGVRSSEVRLADSHAIRTRQAERDARHAQRKREVVEARQAGLTFDEIGTRLGISDRAASKLYRSALRDNYRRASEEERETALLRCDGIIARWWPRLLSADDEVADRATKNLFRAMDFQADLWGLKRTNVDVKVDSALRMPTDDEVWQMLQAYRQRALADGKAVIDVPPVEGEPKALGNGSEPDA
jgi:hypothetical protein